MTLWQVGTQHWITLWQVDTQRWIIQADDWLILFTMIILPDAQPTLWTTLCTDGVHI
jgi:hypothetical protein